MTESKLGIGKDTIPSEVFYNNKLLESDNTFVTGRRAYAILTSNGRGLCGAKKATLESPNVRIQSYESILSGPRLVPPPSLTSVDFSSDGANDIIDAYLWKATVNFTCYSPEQFEDLDRAFFQHFNEVVLTLGWENGNSSVSIAGKIVDYQFTINEKLQFDCSVTFAGSHIESAAGLSNVLDYSSQANAGKRDSSQATETKIDFTPNSLSGVLTLNADLAFINDNALTEPSGIGNDKYGIIKVKNSDNDDWIPDFIYTKRELIYYASLSEIVRIINNLIVNLINSSTNSTAGYFEGFNYFLNEETKGKLLINEAKSSNPYVVLNQWGYQSAYYNDLVDFRNKSNIGWGNDFFIACSEIKKIEGEIRVDKYENPHQVKTSLIEILTKILGRINEAMGNLIDLQIIPYNPTGNEFKYGYEITDRKTCIKSGLDNTKLDILDRSCLARSISVQSNIDSEMAAIALASAQNPGDGGKGYTAIKGVFSCPETPVKNEDTTQSITVEDVQTKINNLEQRKKLLSYAGDGGIYTSPDVVSAERVLAEEGMPTNSGKRAKREWATAQEQKLNAEIRKLEEEKKELQKPKSIEDFYKLLTGNPGDDGDIISEMISLTKEKWAKNPGNISGYKYGVSVTLTVDGYPQHLFGKTFTLSRGLPSMLTKNNVYFVVLKQSHKYSNGDWTMDLEGQMMFDLDGNTPTGSSGGSSGGGTSSSNSPFWRGSSELSQGLSKLMLADILKGLGISSPNQSQISFMVKWRQVEAAKAAWNPFNTTYDMSDGPNGSPSLTFNDHKVKNYSTRENGIRATINTLTTGRYVQYGYDKIVAAIKAIKSDADIDNAMRAVNNSKWGTKFTLPHTTYKTFNNFIWQGPIIKR
jgi:uncharacterized protein (UPF0335 family)